MAKGILFSRNQGFCFIPHTQEMKKSHVDCFSSLLHSHSIGYFIHSQSPSLPFFPTFFFHHHYHYYHYYPPLPHLNLPVTEMNDISEYTRINMSFVCIHEITNKNSRDCSSVNSVLTKNFDLFFVLYPRSSDLLEYYQWSQDETIPQLKILWSCLEKASICSIPIFSTLANKLIKGYFLNVRKIHGNNTPTWTLHTLVRLSINHAQLCNQKEVTLSNTLVAIEVVEESILSFLGTSSLGWKEGILNIDSYGRTLEEKYNGFFRHLMNILRESRVFLYEE
eukprot:TRINITY_DN2027_c0_g2_i12.p1 TRINITY_DN2027_c0_g2~~TRINITY_DN2027_c0_g2_i12.p1  ORF type:complete len:279 (+),score=25.47 TRINITY_DN2027_c0_g2_i12:734-1570(+)